MEQVSLQLINLGAGFDYLAGQVGPLRLQARSNERVCHPDKVLPGLSDFLWRLRQQTASLPERPQRQLGRTDAGRSKVT